MIDFVWINVCFFLIFVKQIIYYYRIINQITSEVLNEKIKLKYILKTINFLIFSTYISQMFWPTYHYQAIVYRSLSMLDVKISYWCWYYSMSILLYNCTNKCGYRQYLQEFEQGIRQPSSLTDNQISNIQIIIYNTDEDENKDNCSICLDDYIDDDELRKLSCNHIFHKECVDIWLKNNSLCPICRRNQIMECV